VVLYAITANTFFIARVRTITPFQIPIFLAVHNNRINQKGYKYIRGIDILVVQMTKTILVQKEILHYPTLKTVLAIEEVIKNSETAISRNKIIDLLPKKVMRSTLNVALDYMQKRGMVLEIKNGFIWTINEKLERNINAKKTRILEV
jgi:hypothetical protein